MKRVGQMGERASDEQRRMKLNGEGLRKVDGKRRRVE